AVAAAAGLGEGLGEGAEGGLHLSSPMASNVSPSSPRAIRPTPMPKVCQIPASMEPNELMTSEGRRYRCRASLVIRASLAATLARSLRAVRHRRCVRGAAAGVAVVLA